MYGSPVCPQIRPCRGLLNRAGVTFEYVDIFKDGDGRAIVRSLNNGYESVPTILFPDGTILTEPSSSQLKGKLAALGFEVRKPTIWELIGERPFFVILAALILLFGLSESNPIFLIIGLLILVYIIVGGWLQS